MNSIRARLRSHDQVQHQSSFFELYWHEFLLRCGYEVEIHPTVSDVTTNPDYLALKEGVPCLYLEATLAMSPRDLAADRRLAELHDTLNRMNSPDYFVSIEYRGSPAGNIRGRNLRERLEEWLNQLDFGEISRATAAQDFDSVPTFPWSEQGLSLLFSPIPKGTENRGRAEVRPIGVMAPLDMRMVRAHDDIKVALEGKAKKYGELKSPFIVAINVMDDFYDEVDLRNALFGEEQVVATRMQDGRWEHNWGTRVPNGAWFGRKGPRNSDVSATLITNQLLPWTLRAERIDLIHNPWASVPLSLDAFPVAQQTVSMPDGIIHRHQGIPFGDVLAVPEQWPIPDD